MQMDPAGAAVKSRARTPTLQHLWVSRNCTLFAPDTSGFHESTKRVEGRLLFADTPTPPKKIIRCLYKQFNWKKKNPSYPNYSVSAISTCHSAYFRCNGYQPQDWKGKEPVTKTDASPWSVRDPVSKPRKGRSWRDGPALCCSGMGTESVPSTPFRLQLPAVPTPWDLMPSLASHDI